MAFTTHVRRLSPRLWFAFKFLRYKHWRGEPEIRILGQMVPRGRMAIDAGASIGLYSRALAALTPKVIAFEANPAVARFAAAVAPANVEVVNVALSRSEGTATLRIPRNARGRTADDLASVEPNNALTGDSYASVEVTTRRLDSFGFSNCGFIKIDVEGHEEAVLDGAEALIAGQHPTLMIELEDSFNPGAIARVTGRLARLGYDGFFLSRHGLRPIGEFRPEHHQDRAALLAQSRRKRRRPDYVVNFFFVPRGTKPQ